MSLARQNLNKEVEDAVNRQILVELSASYNYLAMSAWLKRDSVALHGLGDFFMEHHESVMGF